jgi:hypothetical protein
MNTAATMVANGVTKFVELRACKAEMGVVQRSSIFRCALAVLRVCALAKPLAVVQKSE